MTTVHIDLREPDFVTPVHGILLFYPTRRVVEDTYIVLPRPFSVELTGVAVDVELQPTDVSWAWTIIEQATGGIVRNVSVPDSATPVNYRDLVDVDPGTLAPLPEPAVAPWLDSVTAALIDDSASATSSSIKSYVERGGRCWILVALGQSNNTMADSSYPIGVVDNRITKFTMSGGLTTMSNAELTLTAGMARELVKIIPPTDWIMVVPAAVGSTSFTESTTTVDGVSVTNSWDRTNTTAAVNMYDRAVAWVEAARTAVTELGGTSFIAGVTFSGFEGDAPHLDEATFTAKLADMVVQFRSAVGGGEIPWVIGSFVPEHADLRLHTYTAGVMSALAKIQGNPAVSLVSYFYGPRGYAKVGEAIHYSSAGQIERGKLAVKAWERAWWNRVAMKPLPVPNVRISREAGDKIVVAWDPPYCRVTDYTVEFTFDGGATWIPGNLDNDSRSFATSAAFPWETVRARITTHNSGATTTASVYAYSPTLESLQEMPAALTGVVTVVDNAPISPAHTTAATIYAVYTHPASGGSTTLNARTLDSTRNFLLNSGQSSGTDVAQSITSAGTNTGSFPSPKAAPGPHITAASVSADGTTLTAKRDSAAAITTTIAAGTYSMEILKLTGTGGTVVHGAYIFYGVAHTGTQMAEIQTVLAERHNVVIP